MLIANELRKAYGRTTALDGFTLGVAAGEIVGLIGHNGAGKSTFVGIVSGLVAPDAGTVEIDGCPPGAARQRIGVAPQQLGLYPTATVRDNLRLFGGLAGLRGGALRTAIEETATAVALTDCLDRRVAVLSGGQQRRAQAATALVGSPALLLLDEPTVGADPQTRQALLAVLRRRADAGVAVVYTTHYLPELALLGATVAVAARGRVIVRGEPDRLLRDLPGRVVARFAGGVPVDLRHLGEVNGDELSVATADPGTALTRIIAAGTVPERLDVHTPTLDDLYRSLDGDGAHRPAGREVHA